MADLFCGGGRSPSRRSTRVWVTNEAGDKVARKENVSFERRHFAPGPRILVDPEDRRQRLRGIGTSFTEASAFVLAHLPVKRRREVMNHIFGEGGAHFAMARTVVGSCDFSVEGKYAYVREPSDDLADFSIEVDRDGFSQSTYPGIADESFDLLPMIEEALAIKRQASDSTLRIVASAWTAPPWMKDIKDWYASPSPGNGWQGTGGKLLPEHRATYARYLIKYLDAYKSAGVDIWGLTPVNEPNGNNGQWESMHLTPEEERDFIKKELGPMLRASAHPDMNILIYDQNRDDLERWARTILDDEAAASFVSGVALHWYSSTVDVYESTLTAIHARYPNVELIHTEGTIDDLGKPAPEGVLDPDRFQEEGWFGNDAFWWNENATDWAYTATWAPEPEAHPIYTPVHRYARDIIVGLNHWMTGWIDWNIVLDARGGPNHAGNFCGAPIMIDLQSGEIYYTPVFHVLTQLSRSIRPGDQAVGTTVESEGLSEDALHACATISEDGLLSVQVLNTTKRALSVELCVGDELTRLELSANALQTIQLDRA